MGAVIALHRGRPVAEDAKAALRSLIAELEAETRRAERAEAKLALTEERLQAHEGFVAMARPVLCELALYRTLTAALTVEQLERLAHVVASLVALEKE